MCSAKNKEMERRIGGAIARQGNEFDACYVLERGSVLFWVLTSFDIHRRKPALLSFWVD